MRDWIRAALRRPAVWLPLAAIAAAGLLILLLGPATWWATPAKHLYGKDKADTINATRQLLLAAVGGFVLAIGAGFTARTYFLTRRGQFADRYTKAISQLASDKLTERLGGIYALEHVMAESPRDHGTIVEVLAAFLREQTRQVATPDPKDLARGLHPQPATDVQAALTVLARRPDRPGTRVDLTAARLYGANLSGARLAGAVMNDVQLDGADLNGADLRRTAMAGASLQHAGLFKARLQGALLNQANLHASTLYQAHLDDVSLYDGVLTGVNLDGASLKGAVLAGSDLTRARLDRADLSGTDLTTTDTQGARLTNVTGLTKAQLDSAVVDSGTVLPAEMHGRPEATPGLT